MTYPKDGTAFSTSSGRAVLEVSYDATTSSYSVVHNGTNQTFRQSDRDPGSSTPDLDVFVKSNGSTSESLALTRPDSGDLKYRYVGSGFWQTTTDGSADVKGRLVAFTYGVEMPDSSLPRSGRASYDLDLIGTAAYWDGTVPLRGTGRMDAEFGTQQIAVRGMANQSAAFFGTATLSSATNSFVGHMEMEAFSGPWNGRFYGPSGEEVGASFALSTSAGDTAVGTLMGRIDGEGSPDAASLLTLSGPHTLTSFQTQIQFSQASDGTFQWVPGEMHHDQRPIQFDRTNESYSIAGITFGAGDHVASESNSQLTTYKVTSNDAAYTIHMSKPGADYEGLHLTYTGYGWWTETARHVHFTYGLRTLQGDVPKIGSALYKGVINGTGLGDGKQYAIGGSAEFNFHFDTAWFSGSMAPVAKESGTEQAISAGTFSFDKGTIETSHQGEPSLFYANITDSSGYFLGGITGAFFGPSGEEIGSNFYVTGSDIKMSGTIVGERQ